MSENQKPTVGRIVHYKVSAHDSLAVKSNGIRQEDILPAVIVRVWNDAGVNIKILCDGPIDCWKTSVTMGDGEGQWSWPPRV